MYTEFDKLFEMFTTEKLEVGALEKEVKALRATAARLNSQSKKYSLTVERLRKSTGAQTTPVSGDKDAPREAREDAANPAFIEDGDYDEDRLLAVESAKLEAESSNGPPKDFFDIGEIVDPELKEKRVSSIFVSGF